MLIQGWSIMRKEFDSRDRIEKVLFTEEESCPEIPDKKTEGKTHVEEEDGWWTTPKGQELIRSLRMRYSDDVCAESKYMDRYEHNPFIVEYLRLSPDKVILNAAGWYKEKGTIEAYYTAGLLYRICHDYIHSADCLSKAAEGDIMHEASFYLALMYEDGLLTDGNPDIQSAISWYRRGAKGMDRFSEASTHALKRLGVITCWADLGYDHKEMLEKRKKRQKVELVVFMTVVVPCLAISECFNWVRFKFSSKYRKQVYRNLKVKEKKTGNGLVRPEGDNDKWQRDINAIGRQVYTDEDIYPRCSVEILVPESYEINTDKFTVENYYSIKVPGKFHCLELNKPETLKETVFLNEYMNRNGLTDAVVILNDGSSVYERMRRYYDLIHEFYVKEYMNCHLELLTRKIPPSGINYEKVSYQVILLPEMFMLEKDSLIRLDNRSERIFREYRDRLCKLKDCMSHD